MSTARRQAEADTKGNNNEWAYNFTVNLSSAFPDILPVFNAGGKCSTPYV